MTQGPRHPGRWLHHHLGRRGECLVFFGVLDLVYAWAMISATDAGVHANPTYDWVAQIMPMWFWAALWASVGVICLWHAFRREDRLGFVAAIGIKVLWGLVSLGGCAADNVSVASVAIWLGLAGLVWRISGWRESDRDGETES